MKRRTAFAVMTSLLAVALACDPAGAVETIIDRGLPVENLNNAAGVMRSNVSWTGPDDGWFSGDTFVMPDLPPGTNWTIETIRIWSPAIPVNSGLKLADIYHSITLYGKQAGTGSGDPFPQLASGTIVDNTSDNPNIVFTPVYYDTAGTTSYQGENGEFWQIWQVDFTNLNWVVPPSAQIQFGVDAAAVSVTDFWYNHASNAANGGVPADGADGKLWYFNAFDSTEVPCVSTEGGENADLCPWDKPSDINVQVFGRAPEPSAASLALIGLFGLYGVRRWRT